METERGRVMDVSLYHTARLYVLRCLYKCTVFRMSGQRVSPKQDSTNSKQVRIVDCSLKKVGTGIAVKVEMTLLIF